MTGGGSTAGSAGGEVVAGGGGYLPHGSLGGCGSWDIGEVGGIGQRQETMKKKRG